MNKRASADAVLSDAAARRVIREDLLTNILVEAGAGSGKTQMLAERMAAGVASGAYAVEHMAAVTFTRKAASELRGRFHLALEEALRAGPATGAGRGYSPGEDARLRIQHALSNLERFFAGTIHSFCARLLRERPVESGVSPGFTELDELQDLELRKRAWRDFVTSARASGNATMLALLDAEMKPQDLDSAFATICLHDDVEFPAGDVACPDAKAARTALEKFWKALQAYLPVEIDPATTCGIQKAAREFRGQYDVSRYRLDRPSAMASLLATWDVESTIVQKRWSDDAGEKKRLRDLIQGLHARFHAETVAAFLSQWRQYVYRLSVTLLMEARAHAAAERRRVNALNYGDLLVLTARVLRDNEQVRRSLQDKYRHLFVDEFQDTDPVQAEIVFWLAEDVNGAAGSATSATSSRKRPSPLGPRSSALPASIRDWRTVPLRPGALFVVGDPKQSIYRFRRADIDIYNIVRERFSDPAVGRVVSLTTNFRSVKGLCDWANDVFRRRFPEKPTAHSPRFAALDAHDTSAAAGLFTLTHPGDAREVIVRDAERIATYIRSEVDANRRKFGDFLILTRKKRMRIVPYAAALEALNIPLEVSGAGAFGESEEVATLTMLLRALSDPLDPLPLIAVLRGALFGISDRELFAFRQSGGWFSIVGPAEDPVASSTDPVAGALGILRRWHRWTRVLPAAAALDRILEDSGYLALASTTPGGVEAGDLLHALDRVRRVVEEGGSLADAADALVEDAEERNEVESLPLEPGRTDVVRVMNLHKAKGLEAAVVILADPCGGFNPRVDVHIERKGLTAQGWFEVARKNEEKPWFAKVLGAHADWDAHKASEQPYLDSEQDRLLYVAATRAREMLVVSRWTGNARTPAWGVLNECLPSAKELSVPGSVTAPAVAPLDCSSAALAASETQRAAAHARAREASWSITSVTAEARHVATMTRAAEPSADDPTRVVTTDTPTHRADAGMAWGTLIHGLLEHAMRHKGSTRGDLRRLAMWLTVEEPQLRGVVDEAIDTVERTARASFWQVARNHTHSVEVPFITNDCSRVTNGVIDLLFKAEDTWHVVDYKTDLLPEEGRHTTQVDEYRYALAKLGCATIAASVVNVRPERA